ncbi:MAG TPA: response regulator [Planctomycetota bacterium]|nr:response regulator [Planctomycetota bacterium]
MRALIVGGSGRIPATLRGELAKAGFQVLESGDEEEALELLEEQGPVDLALVSWDLPEAGGLRFVLRLRSARRFDSTRLLMLMRQPSTADILEAVRIGVDDCLVEPFTSTQLVDKLSQLRLIRPRAGR